MRSSTTAVSEHCSGIEAFDPLRDEPRFKAVLAKLALPYTPPASHEAMSERPSFFAELKRRNVYKVAVAYIVAGWALSQGIAQVFPVFDIPNWAIRLIVLLIIIGLPIATDSGVGV